MKWTDNTTYAFVQEYLKHECLYNIKCKNYRIKQARDAAIIKICEVMNIKDFGPKEALSKIKSIRSTYSQEVKKINESTKSGAGTDDVYIPSLKWFTLYHDAMNDKFLTPKESQSNLISEETAMEGTGSAVDESTIQEVPGSSKGSQDTPIVQETQAAKKPVYSRKRSIKCLEGLVDKVKAVGEMVQTPMPDNDNEFNIFGRSIAAQLNAMPLMLALQAQSHIQNYLTSLRMHSIVNPNIQDYSPSPPSITTYVSSPSPTTNSSASRVSLDNNPTENIASSLAPASPATYDIPSSVVINSSGSGVPLDNNPTENIVVYSLAPASTPATHDNLEVYSLALASPAGTFDIPSGPSLDNNDESTVDQSDLLQLAINSIIKE